MGAPCGQLAFENVRCRVSPSKRILDSYTAVDHPSGMGHGQGYCLRAPVILPFSHSRKVPEGADPLWASTCRDMFGRRTLKPLTPS